MDKSRLDGLLSVVDLHFFDVDDANDWRAWEDNTKDAVEFANEVFDELNLKLFPTIEWKHKEFWRINNDECIKLPESNVIYKDLNPAKKALFVKFSNMALLKMGFCLTIGLENNLIFASRRRPTIPPTARHTGPPCGPRLTGPIPTGPIPTESILDFYDFSEDYEDGRGTGGGSTGDEAEPLEVVAEEAAVEVVAEETAAHD